MTASAMRVKRKLGLGLKSGGKKHRKMARKKRRKMVRKKRGSKLAPAVVRRSRFKRKKKSRRIIGVSKKRNTTTFNTIVKNVKKTIEKGGRNATLDDHTRLALTAVRQKFKQKKNVHIPRVIPIPKRGGALPLIPILASISALGGAAGGVSSIVQAVSDIIDARKNIFPGEKKQIGNGLYLTPYKKNGLGLYLNPYMAKN